MALLTCGFVGSLAAQERLSDAADGLSLDHPTGDRIIVIEGTESDERRTVDGDFLIGMTEELLRQGRAAESVLLELRERDLFFDEGWRSRMSAALTGLEGERRSIEFVEEPARYVPAANVVRDGARHYQIAAGVLRWAMLRDETSFSAAFGEFETGNRGVITGLAQLQLEWESETREQRLPPPDAFTVRQAMAELCGSRYGDRHRADYDLCIERQEAALRAINSRYGFSVGLDEPTFNSIRADCREAWPDDLVAQDRCEVSRTKASPNP
jgi:hypothetical protein